MDSHMYFKELEVQKSGCHVCLMWSFNIPDSESLEATLSSSILPKWIFILNIIIFKHNTLFIFIENVTKHVLTFTWAFMMCINLDISSGHSRRKWKWSKIILGFLKEK